MATRRSKNGEEEKLDSATIQKVIQLLSQEKPITKKEACQILNIAYNTTRLNSILEKHKQDQERNRQKRAERRGKPANPGEIQFVVSSYLEGGSIEHIAESIYRSGPFVKGVLEEYQVPIRNRKHDYFNPSVIPDGAVRTKFDIGSTVYSARYDSVATIEGEFPHHEEYVYRIWLKGDRWQQYAYQPASELASLEHLEPLGIKL